MNSTTHPASETMYRKECLAIGGLTPFSTLDWPGKLCATVFTQGCPWRCPYCHNAEMQSGPSAFPYGEDDVIAFLRKRTGLLDGVVISGGEPTLQSGLTAFLQQVKSTGLAIGLHTGGAFPQRLSSALPFLDWVGFDYKTIFQRYEDIVGASVWGERARESLKRVMKSGIAFEVRTTIDARHFSLELMNACEDELRSHGITSWVLQICNEPTQQGALTMSAPSKALIDAYLKKHPHSIARLRDA